MRRRGRGRGGRAPTGPQWMPHRAGVAPPCRSRRSSSSPFGCSSRGGSLSGLTEPCLGYSGPPSVCEGPFKIHSEKGNSSLIWVGPGRTGHANCTHARKRRNASSKKFKNHPKIFETCSLCTFFCHVGTPYWRNASDNNKLYTKAM